MPGKYFRMMFVHRFSFVRYGNISTSYTADEKEYFRLAQFENRTVHFGETTMGIQCPIPGANWMSIETSCTFSSQPTQDFTKVRARGFNTSIGLSFDISKMFK
jgi:hypothetical protein